MPDPPKIPGGPPVSSKAVGASEERFRQLVSGVTDYAIFQLDSSGRVLNWNEGAQRLKQYTADEIVGKHFSVFYPQEALDRRFPDMELEVAAQVGRFEDEGWRVRKDGTLFWANVVITALRDESGVLFGYLKITRDLTERRQTEEVLRQSEEKFRLLVEGVMDYAIFMLDPDGRVASWNVGAERIKGYRADEIIGRHFSAFYPREAISDGKPERELREALEHGRVEDEGWRVRKNGERFWANVVITALHGADGVLRGFAKITRDLSERRRVEALREADRQKNEFLALLAHELRNPLAPIRTALHVIGQPRAEPSEIARAHAIAERQLRHMARLMDDLLDVVRVGEGRIDLKRETVDLRDLVRRAVEAAGSAANERRHSVEVDLPPDPIRLSLDPTRIEQVLANLLGNAIKYTDRGGAIRVKASRDGGDAVIEVSDNGIGIEPKALPRIFDLFVQEDRRLDRSVGGMGIGLTLVRRLVELHGGTVEASSPGPRLGSRFLVYLPLRQPGSPAEALAPEDDLAAGAPPPIRILVVDDNVDAAESLMMMMKILGQDVRVAFDGPTALDIATQFRPELVFLDIGMPEMDGYEVARRIRGEPLTRDARLVALTGWGQVEDREHSRRAGFDEHLVKPADPAVLERVLAGLRE
jgi:PAS domain S-box-containing protein